MSAILATLDLGTLHLTLNRPARLNALDGAMLDTLAAIIATATADPPGFITLTGAGPRAFCAGADLHEVAGLDLDGVHARNDRARNLFEAFARLPCPSLAIINGIAMGGGLELALACTFRIAHASARLALPEVKLGVMPTYGGTQRLPALIGRPAALRLMLSGETIDAGEAHRLGLVEATYEGDGLAAAQAFLAPMRPHPATARRALLQACDGAADLAHEGRIARDLLSAPGALDGIHSFAAGRKD